MKRDDPKKLKLRGDRERARLWLEILCQGIGKSLMDRECRYSEDIRGIIERVNGELIEAVSASERAEKAYEPYWSRGRVRISGRKPKTAKKKAA